MTGSPYISPSAIDVWISGSPTSTVYLMVIDDITGNFMGLDCRDVTISCSNSDLTFTSDGSTFGYNGVFTNTDTAKVSGEQDYVACTFYWSSSGSTVGSGLSVTYKSPCTSADLDALTLSSAQTTSYTVGVGDPAV